MRQAAGIRSVDVFVTRVTDPGIIEVKVLPTLSLAELLDRYHIDQPIDEENDREAWEANAAAEVLGQFD